MAGGEGLLPGRPHCLSHRPEYFLHELIGVFEHHGIRNAQQPYADHPQIIFFPRISAHLANLGVNTAIKFNGQSMFEAVETQPTARHAPSPAPGVLGKVSEGELQGCFVPIKGIGTQDDRVATLLCTKFLLRMGGGKAVNAHDD